jgi:hypothetical protein
MPSGILAEHVDMSMSTHAREIVRLLPRNRTVSSPIPLTLALGAECRAISSALVVTDVTVTTGPIVETFQLRSTGNSKPE